MAKSKQKDQSVRLLGIAEIVSYNPLPLHLELREYERASDYHHKHLDFYEIAIILSGSAKSGSPEGDILLNHGDVIIFSPGTSHRYYGIRKLRHYNFLFSPSILKNCFADSLLPAELQLPEPGRIRLLHLGEPELLESIIRLESMSKEFYNYTAGRAFAVNAEFARSLVYILRHALPGEKEKNTGAYQISRVLLHINQNPAVPYCLEELAAYAGMSVSSFRHRFREHTGFSPKEYIMRLKLRQAALIMTGPHFNITQAAVAAGFSDGNYFARCFKQTFGRTPREFRQAWSEGKVLPEQLLKMLPESGAENYSSGTKGATGLPEASLRIRKS